MGAETEHMKSGKSQTTLRRNVADAPIGDVEQAAAGRVKAACSLLTSGSPELARFCNAFYSSASPEDLERFTIQGLASLAEVVFDRSELRRPKETLVETFDFMQSDGGFRELVLLCVNEDMPFLFDSLMEELTAEKLRLHGVFHPVIAQQRDQNGRRIISGDAMRESVIVLLLDPLLDQTRRDELVQRLRNVFDQVRLAVRDWKKMVDRLRTTIEDLKRQGLRIAPEILSEDLAFLEWVAANHFTFLGCRDYEFDADEGRLAAVPQSGVGVLSDTATRVIGKTDQATLSAEIREFLAEPDALIITKTSERSLVHRRVHMDYIGVKLFRPDGTLHGERRFVGLFTSSAYGRRPSEIPLLRLKVSHILQRAGFARDSHDGKALAHILDTYPREELFQANEDEIFNTAIGVLRLGERPRVRVFLRFDRFDRFVSALVYVPRDRYDDQVGRTIHGILARAFNGRMTAASPVMDETLLTRIHFIVGRNEGPRPEIEVRQLEAEIRSAIRTWSDAFAQLVISEYGEAEGLRILRRNPEPPPARYRDAFAPEEAIKDLVALRGYLRSGTITGVRVYQNRDDAKSTLKLKVYTRGDLLPLSVSLPIFENLGFRVIAENSYRLSFNDEEQTHIISILDFQMERDDGVPVSLAELKPRLEEAFRAVVAGEAENDGFNRLIVCAGLPWRDAVILRACAKFLRQTGIAFSQDYMEQTLSRNPDIAALLVSLFRRRHDPDQPDREAAIKSVQIEIDHALHDVPSLDDDRIIRRMRNVIECTLRTNFFYSAEHGGPSDYLAIKLDSHKVEELPAPRPFCEIFVYSPSLEGTHLRFGKIARGGIRWSDRREDFRTEILGLVKAQQVKNAVIVPVGAKGGFIPKRIGVQASREEVQAVGVACYKTLINALLDLTDNIAPDGAIIPPTRAVRHDADDPYLVVAADKGTATFSDFANEIAQSRGFWLGDAFASGGSHGYDHKKMGITAKGAWEAVKRHFREMGRDIQNETFTCVGVGDMSGDVFGNGMLLSEKTKLLAAFDHRHIFLDPDPDPKSSWKERKRLFDLRRSSWADYDTAAISGGGGVFSRSLKEIALSPQIKTMTGLIGPTVSPGELIKALLKIEIDLLWFGGIGTFIKAASQTNVEVGDRANDPVRINGRELRARVVGEGANLGMTQLGRVEYALNGGRLNTDAIDNSAGVDTSDHEVNIKILFSGPLRRGEISEKDRDDLLISMTEDVAAHVLRDNYDQTLAISVAETRSARDLDSHSRFIRDLERRGSIDRAVEFLPGDDELHRRAQSGHGLTRPELAVLLAYAKLDLDAQLASSDLPDQPFFASELASYFPSSAVSRFPDEMIHHRLRREIIATALANRMVNLGGPVFVHRIEEISSATGAAIARAFVLAEGAFELTSLKLRIDSLDNRVAASVQLGAYNEIAELLRRLGLWFLVNIPSRADLGETISIYRSGVQTLRGTYSNLVSDYEATATERRVSELRNAGVPVDIAEDVAVLQLLGGTPEIILLAQAHALPADYVAGAYFAVGAAVGLDRLRGLANQITGHEHWDRLAVRRIVDDLYAGQRALAAEALASASRGARPLTRADGANAVKRWAAAHADALTRTRSFLTELERSGDLSIAKLTLANSQIHALAVR
ncbi:MAG TPA: NAD-glutamate dehydrogenase [Rhizomicrobium sp.]|jgi:glutamate dehydrogenase|nr:NAD-glutamate dehydrogenase [Rhizomicrobium sp.]